ncbi:hypothetical protein [Halarcobacter ebronensis]|uniref:Lipoprotein n=1 Tax=Halarcobacter ebronensis TaxID=1462615 RepID=A0A4Q1ATG9_9BACT|nr:hypothetical protein [Halarcobacter ebronensis]QKF83512.1 hypothetical protein AEBR_3066 [Halarcobacter ebronensis]RXK08306.1 hypothetical protein CRV07_00430 [Halarcobacter ebronensis]
MKSTFKVLAIISVALLLFTGCRTAAVYNVVEQPTRVKNDVTNDKIFKAIKTAGLSLGWQVRKVKDGLAEAQLNIRTHMALVEIPYTHDSFSINYKNSANLNYDATKGTIHNNYNGWVQNLRNAITLQISALE